jgi:translocation protein SEC63
MKSEMLVNGLLQIAMSRSWLNMSMAVIDLSQLIVQALFYRQSPFYQLPHLNADILKHFKTKKV